MSRTWKCVVGIAAILVIAGVLVVVIVIARFVGAGDSVDAEIARIKAEGGPTAADLAGEPIPDSENGAVVYRKCVAYLPRSREAPDSKTVESFIDPEKRVKDPELRNRTRMLLPRYVKAITLAEKAAAKPKCRFPVNVRMPYSHISGQSGS